MDNLISPIPLADIGKPKKKPPKKARPPYRKAELDRHVRQHVAHVKAGKAPPGPKGPLTPAEQRYVQLETQKRIAKGPAGPLGPVKPPRTRPRGPRGPLGPVLPQPAPNRPWWVPDVLAAPPRLGPSGTGAIGVKASRADQAVAAGPIHDTIRGLAPQNLGPAIGKNLYHSLGLEAGAHFARNPLGYLGSAEARADDARANQSASNAIENLTGYKEILNIAKDPVSGGIALGALTPFGRIPKLVKGAAKVGKGAEATGRVGRAVEARAAKKALVRGPKRTPEEADAHVAERIQDYAGKVDKLRADGKMGGPVNLLKPGEVTAETGGVLGQTVRHALHPDLKEGGKYTKVGAKPDDPVLLRKEQEELRAPYRLEQAAAMRRAGEGKSGLDRLKAVSAARAGKHPSLEFRGLAKLTPEMRDEAIDFILDHPNLRVHEGANAAEALDEILAGKVPTPGDIQLLERAFGREMAPGLIAEAKRAGWGKTALDTLGISRALRSTMDFSFMLRQAAVALAYNPKIWGKEIGPAFKGMFSEKTFQAGERELDDMLITPMAEWAGVARADIGASRKTGAGDLYLRDEAMPSNIAERIPLGVGATVRGSDRGYVGLGNRLRMRLFDYMVRKAAREGFHLTDDLVKDIAHAVNSMTGRGDLEHLKSVQQFMNVTLFSPRLLKSRIDVANPYWYYKLSPFARKEAAKGGVRFFGTIGLTLMAIEEMTGGHVEFNPQSANFGKVVIGDTRIDLGAGFSQLLHLYGQVYTPGKGFFQRKSSTTGRVSHLGGGYGQDSIFDVGVQFFTNKTNPILSTGINIARQNQFGRPLDFSPNPLHTESLISNLWEPMSANDAASTAQHYDSPLIGLGAGLLAATGVGVQTYGADGADSPDKIKDATKEALKELQHQLHVLNVPPKWRHVYGKAVRMKVQRDLAKDQARKESPDGTITDLESYKITLQTLVKNKAVTPAEYRDAVAAVSKMDDREIRHWEYEAWTYLGPNNLGPGKLLEALHHSYNLRSGE